MVVQAGGARRLVERRPDQARDALTTIEETGRDALTEMRRLLGVMRTDVPGDAELAPQPGLARLEALLDDARAAGTDVRLHVEGDPIALPPGVDLTAYRVVQEALTNARRHAPGAAVDVDIHYGAEAVRVSVRDDGPGPSGTGDGGHGLVGMHERVAMVGGRLRVGPGEGGGFAVQADLPIGASPQ
jgi:signal transduction histidine kinase